MLEQPKSVKVVNLIKALEYEMLISWYLAVTYAAAEHQGRLFWITCKPLKLLRKASCLQVIQNSAPSVVQRRQCDIYKLKEGKNNHNNWPRKLEILSSPDQVDFQSHILHHQ